MSNEEFQRIVLEKLGQLESGQEEIKKSLSNLTDQVLELTEFKSKAIEELSEIKSTLSRVEINTADNWSDIAKMKSVR